MNEIEVRHTTNKQERIKNGVYYSPKEDQLYLYTTSLRVNAVKVLKSGILDLREEWMDLFWSKGVPCALDSGEQLEFIGEL